MNTADRPECGAECVLAEDSSLYLIPSSKIANFCCTESCRTKNWVEFCEKSIALWTNNEHRSSR